MEVYQFVCDRNAMYDAGKEDYLRPSQHIGLASSWVGNPQFGNFFKDIINLVALFVFQ